MKNEAEQITWFDLGLWSGKTSPEHSRQACPKERTSELSSRKPRELRTADYQFLDLRTGHGGLLGVFWETNSPSLGEFWTRGTGPAPHNGTAGSSLSQILLRIVPPKYYLSKKACLGILRRAGARNKNLPEQLEDALKIQAGLRASSAKGTGNAS